MAKKQSKNSIKAAPQATVLHFNDRNTAIGDGWIYAFAVVLFAPTIVAPLFTKYGYSPDLHMAYMIQTGLLLLLTAFLFAHRRWQNLTWVKEPLTLPALLFYGWALLSIFWAHNRFESMISTLDWGAGVLCFLLIAHGVRKVEHIRALVLAIFFTGVALSFLGWNQYLLGVEWVQQHAPPSATFNNKNMAAQYGVLVMPLSIGLFMAEQRRLAYWLYAFSITLTFVFVMYTVTRNAYLNLAGILAALVLFSIIDHLKGNRWHFSKDKWIAFLCALTVGFFALLIGPGEDGGIEWIGPTKFFGSLFGEIESIHGSAKLDGTGVPRVAMWFNSLEMVKDNLLTGVGMGNWMVHYPLYQTAAIIDFEMSESIQHINAHNDYVEILSDLGIIGLLLLFFLGFRLFRTALTAFFPHPDNPNRFIILGVLLGCMGIGINAFFSFPFKQPAPIMVFMAYLGILSVEHSRVKNALLKQVPAANKALTASFISATVFATIFTLHYQWNQSEIHFRLATISSQQQKFHVMKREGQRSFDALPIRSRMLNFVGMGHMRTGNPQAAAEYLERVKASYPHRNNTLQNLGYIYLELAEDARRKNRTKDYTKYLEKARENFAHLTDIRPDNARAHRNLGVTYVRLNQPKPAYIHLETSTALEAANGKPVPQNVKNLIKQLKEKANTG